MLTEPVHHWHRLPTEEELAIGTYGPSGRDNLWLVADVLTDEPLLVLYPEGQEFEICNIEDWRRLPREGVQFIIWKQSCWQGADEYHYHGQEPRFGLMMKEHEYRVLWHRAWGIVHQRAADKEKLERGD